MREPTKNPTTPSRRAARRGGIATLATGGLTLLTADASPVVTITHGAPNPDAELFALAAVYFKEQVLIDAWNRGDISEEDGEAADRRQDAALFRMTDIPAATLGGIHAKARVTLRALQTVPEFSRDPEESAALSVLSDLVREVLV